MNDNHKSKAELVEELEALRQQAAHLEEAESKSRYAEEAAKESQKRYRAFVENGPSGVWEINPDGTTIYMNRAMCAMLEIESPEDLNGKTCHSFFTPQSLETMAQEQAKGNSGIDSSYAVEIIGKRGGRRKALIQGTLVSSSEGEPKSLIGIFNDITDRGLAVESLRKWAYIFEYADWGVGIVGAEGKTLILMNPAFARMHGYTMEELIGRPVTEVFAPEYRGEMSEQIGMANEKDHHILEAKHIRKDGTVFPAQINVTVVKDKEGRVQFRAIHVQDITERKQAEESLRESEESYRDLVESSRDLMCTHNLKGQILWVNEEPARILGYAKNDILKMNIRDLLVPERRDEFDEFLATMRSQGVAKGLMMVQTAKGERRIWEYQTTLRTEGVTEPVVRSMASDVTERMHAEKEVKETVKRLRKAMEGIIQAMALTVESKDPYTAGHQLRVSHLAKAIAQEMRLPEDQIEAVRMAGMVHDLGKISFPAQLLSKPTQLSDLEFGLIKVHPQISYDILKDIDFPWPVAQIVFQHHERINGSGYPLGLFGNEIYLEAKILAVADVVEAIASHRPYRPALGITKALEEISQKRDIFYDPVVVDACLKLFKEGYKLER